MSLIADRPGCENKLGGGAIELAGVEMREFEPLGEAARQRSLARGSRPVDRDDERGRRACASSTS
jgi:hypothetical protein